MIRIGASLLLLAIHINTALAQSGDYLVSKHAPAIDQQNIYYNAIIDDAGITFIASRNGLVKYDGRRATMINAGGSVFDVAINNQQDIFIGTSLGLLKMDINENGKPPFRSLMPANDRSSIDQVLTSEQGIYALTDKVIYYRAYGADTTIMIQDEYAGKFHNIYELDGQIYVNSENKGTLKVEGNKCSSEIPAILEKEALLFAIRNDDTNHYVSGSANGSLLLFQNGQLNYLKMGNQSLVDAEPITALWYSDEVVVVGTLTGGVFFVNTKTGKIESKVDYNAGLEDNEVLSLAMDKNKGISVISNYAMMHISPNIPIKSFQYYEGLSGDITATTYHKDVLYVGTNVGLYKLQQITDFEEVVSYKKRRTKKKTPQVATKQKKGLFGLRRKKDKKDTEPKVTELVVTEKQITKKVTDIYYTYKEVDERISHTSQMLTDGNSLIVGGLSGAFEVLDGVVTEISSSDIQYMYLSEDTSKLFLCTGDEQVLVFVRKNGEWVFRDVFTDFSARISHIIQHEGYFWLCSPDRIYKVEISSNELEDIEEFAFQNPYNSTVYASVDSEGMSFINSDGVFTLQDDSIRYKLNLDRIDNIILDNKNNVWTFSNGKWLKPNQTKAGNSIFGIFKDLKNISYDESNTSYWVVTADNKLMAFDRDAEIPPSAYIPYLEEGETKAGDFVVEQDENKLLFVISYADLPNIMDAKYRYQLKGMDDSWSDWGTESTINFAFLPAGNYTLMIEAQNALGELHKISPVSFEVLPPYWKQPLFYAFEIAVVLSLFLLSITLKSWGYKYRLLSRLLAFLTLVIIMEYMEVVMESYFLLESSPVLSFALQVLMAMIILPFEGVLKKYVFKEKIDLGTYFELKGKEKFGES